MPFSHVATRDDAALRPDTTTPRRSRVTRLALAAAASALASASFAGPALAAQKAHTARSATYTYTTVDNHADPTFNQLLGIDKSGEISGYFGSGAAGHPNQGYLTSTGNLGSFTPENFSESVQTQVTGLSDNGVTVGFWSDSNNGNNMDANFGFWSAKGHYHTVVFPTASGATPEVNQLLGVNDSDLAVGFYIDAQGNSHGYTYNILTDTYREHHDSRRDQRDHDRDQQPRRRRGLLHRRHGHARVHPHPARAAARDQRPGRVDDAGVRAQRSPRGRR